MQTSVRTLSEKKVFWGKMPLKAPQYSGQDYIVLAVIILPVAIALNSIIFGSRYFTSSIFLPATLITGLLFSLEFFICGMVAMVLKMRMPQERQTSLRLFCMIGFFILLSGIFLSIVFNGYEVFPFFGYTFNRQGFIWAYFSMAIVNIFLTLLMEGIYRYNTWRDNLKETERLKKAFTQSQLLGLKSQIAPHFLFNSLNTLSSLIEEDDKEAEIFLNEMSKVYRYMLRGDEEQLVPLHTELKFIGSYIHLLTKRFGQSLHIETRIDEGDMERLLPPLSLQVLVENAFTQNSMSKTDPLRILIASNGSGELLVRNTRRPKQVGAAIDFEAGLDNLITKYKLLCSEPVVIEEEPGCRNIFLPLMNPKAEPA